jgi:membrane protein implicated in regulation of membrane protease activity
MKIVIVALALSLLLLGFSGALFAFDVPVWLSVVLVVLSVLLVALMASKVAKKMRKERHGTTTKGVPMTPRRHTYTTPDTPPAPRRGE